MCLLLLSTTTCTITDEGVGYLTTFFFSDSVHLSFFVSILCANTVDLCFASDCVDDAFSARRWIFVPPLPPVPAISSKRRYYACYHPLKSMYSPLAYSPKAQTFGGCGCCGRIRCVRQPFRWRAVRLGGARRLLERQRCDVAGFRDLGNRGGLVAVHRPFRHVKAGLVPGVRVWDNLARV